MVIDVFKIMFEADTSTLEKGTKKSEQQAEKLNNKLKQTDKLAEGVGGSLKDLLATGLGALTAIASFGGIVSGVMGVANYSDELAKNSALLGENINELAAYQDLAIKSGGSADGLTDVFKNLNSQIAEFATTGNTGALPYFQKLGISLLDASGKAKKVSTILPELASKFEGMSKLESAGIGSKLGLDEGTITLLQQGRKAFDEQLKKQKELFTITKEQAKASEDFNDTVHDTKTAFRGLFLTLSSAILPALRWLLEKFQTVIVYLRKNGDFAKGIFIALGVAIATFLIPVLGKMAIASIAAFAPFYAIGAVVATLVTIFGLLYDDIMTFLAGGDSAFGSLLEYMGLTKDEIQAVKDAFQAFGDFVLGIISLIGDGFKMLGQGIVAALKGAFAIVEPIIKALLGVIKDTISGVSTVIDVAKSAGNLVGEGIDAAKGVGNLIGGGIDAVSNFFGSEDNEQPINPVQATSNNPLNTITSNSNSSNKSVKIDKVEVVTQSTDPQAIARDINKTLADEITNASNNLDDGVLG